MNPTFDLITQPWIPCVDADHRPVTLGLRDVLLRAHELREVSDNSPLSTLAIHRLLLAVLHRAMDGPADQASWRTLWASGRLPADALEDYLSAWAEHFDIFHEQHPFYQVGGLETVDKKGTPTPPVPIAKLAVERVAGNNAMLFDHSADAESHAVSAPQAARYLVATQAWALGGGRGPYSNIFGLHPYASHATQVGGVAVLLRGSNLARTLMLNLVPYDATRPMPRAHEDLPVWERPQHRPPGTTLVDGYLDYLTLPCRYVRLIPEGSSSDVVVRHAYIAPGLALPSGDAGPMNPLWFQRLDAKRGPVSIPLRVDKAVWRDSSPLFALPKAGQSFDGRPLALRQAQDRSFSRLLGADARLMVTCYGLANDKAKALAWRCEELPAPVRLLEDADLVEYVADAVADAEQAAQAIGKAFRTLAFRVLEANEKAPDPKDVSRLSQRMQAGAGFWPQLDEPFRRFLRGLDQDADEALGVWTYRVLHEVKDAFQRGARFSQGGIDRQLRALVLAETNLHKNLRPLRDRVPQFPVKEA